MDGPSWRQRPSRGGGGGGGGRGRGGGGRGGPPGGNRGRGGPHRGGRGGGHSSNGGGIPVLADPSQDPAFAPKPPHPGFFHTSFVENPWYELEEKLGIPHITPVVSAQSQEQTQQNGGVTDLAEEQPQEEPREADAPAQTSPS